jgi:hypothetical protein
MPRQLSKHEYFQETQVRDLIKALWDYPKGRDCQRVYDDVLRRRQSRGEEIPKNFESSVRSAFNQYNRDGSVWRKKGAKPENALFCCPKGLGAGIWAIDRERAEKWLAESPFKGGILTLDVDSSGDF